MLPKNLLNELTEAVGRVLPQAQALGEEARESVQGALRQALSKMDLVTREEFEANERALARAEQRIAELESAIAALQQSRQSQD